MKMLVLAVVVLMGVGAAQESGSKAYGVDCAAGECDTGKNLVCKQTRCTCNLDDANLGMYLADTSNATSATTSGCTKGTCNDKFKCGAKAQCDTGNKYCKCEDGYVVDTEVKVDGPQKPSFVCKEPENIAECGVVEADFKVDAKKCACKDSGKDLNYDIAKGSYKCVKSGGMVAAPMILCLVAMATIGKLF